MNMVEIIKVSDERECKGNYSASCVIMNFSNCSSLLFNQLRGCTQATAVFHAYFTVVLVQEYYLGRCSAALGSCDDINCYHTRIIQILRA